MINFQNANTKVKRDVEKLNSSLSKEILEDFLNFKLSLRKKNISNHIIEKRTKLEDKNNDNKINNRKKLYEYKKKFEIEKITETFGKIISNDPNINYLKDKNIIELIHLYSQHLNSNDNVKNVLGTNIDKIINIFLNEILKDINSQSINFELFDYYLIILGNLFIYKASTYDNDNNDYLSLLLNIINKNTNLEMYKDYNFDIINDTLWLIYLYIYFDDKHNMNTFPFIIKTVNDLFNNDFYEDLRNFSTKGKNDKISSTIVKEIIYSGIHIYLSIFENLIVVNKNRQIIIQKEDLQNCFDILIMILNFNLFKDIFIEDSTNIISLILAISRNIFTLDFSQFYPIYIDLFEKYKNYEYDNKNISKNLIFILFYLIENYCEDKSFFQILNDSSIIPICIQYYLKNGSIINIVLKTLNMFFKYPFNYHKLIIKSINYQLLDKTCEIISNIDNNENIIYECLNILINAYAFLENNMKNPSNENILRYYDLKIISKIEQLILHDNKNICEMASFLYKKFKNIES